MRRMAQLFLEKIRELFRMSMVSVEMRRSGTQGDPPAEKGNEHHGDVNSLETTCGRMDGGKCIGTCRRMRWR